MFFAIASCYNNVKYNIKLYNINILYYIDLYKRNNYVAQMHQPQQKKNEKQITCMRVAHLELYE